MRYYRETRWIDEHGNVVQVSAAVLADDWEDLAIVTEHVGPFDVPESVMSEAMSVAEAAADSQMPGQLRLA